MQSHPTVREQNVTTRAILLGCGAVASVLYVGTDVLAAVVFPEYHSFTSRAVSELMASGAPTEKLVDPLFLVYTLLMTAFGVGVWLSGSGFRLRATASVLVLYGLLGLLGPTVFEMNVRGSGGDSTNDVLHIAVTAVLVVLIFAAVGLGASLGSRTFRSYSFATILVMLAGGIAASFAMSAIDRGEPTPWVGLAERIDIGAFLLWVVLFARSLLRRPPLAGPDVPSGLTGARASSG